MLKGKTIILGVTGSIAAYKAANIASMLVKQHADLTVIMTKNALNFINPIVFETLTGNKCLIDTFDRNFQYSVEHVSLAKKASAFVVAPASADIIAKMAYGIADDMLTTTILACNCTKIVAPAMNTNMYLNPITLENIQKLENHGFKFITPASGMLACKDVGIGKLPSEEEIVERILYEVALKKKFEGKKILITAGPTIEAIDPVRFISNHSTGKMGFALAKMASFMGANVTLVSGKVNLKTPYGVERIDIESAKDMYESVVSRFEEYDIIIKAAAVADYTPAHYSDEKIKKKDSDSALALVRTKDILKYLGEHKKEGQFICGFSMETENMLENSKEKLLKKNADMIVANSIKQEGAGFAGDTNIVTIISKDEVVELPILSKEETALEILYNIEKHLAK
ncbi:phosphopantothenoylcysteine decarboxylase / phosphopantothenate--cysteine ligase [Acetitomaculum ruminis DSM 5522]|uniref:Coenzyme A biosynthesis bifunctional protein CoaBC n=1 Tax=Acetitomaculum ruminis DSM 5522 TaxID=1120918 RepID=A0A1I0UXK8_9FIRM|nr:bifunctional phosphopantothenoylcysteine decarboxylase/phosphopantothenate--cysteine ligase CoaBC [Acetitomaculum ruminis]SFA68795.1 phosphopantothenoylcysteine decarboxylase / phosphopantothenate--cysteine ligase [Acetitomaculum ruminis DSM 5522]